MGKDCDKNFIESDQGYAFNKKIKNSIDFCKSFLDIFNIACTPGSAFGNDNYIRICYSTDNNTLKDVIRNLIKNTRLL